MNQEIRDLIQRRRLQVLVHSCIYYELNSNIITDEQWDKWARELVQLQKDYPEESESVIWFNAFVDWDASTGAFLPLTDEWVVRKAKWLLLAYRRTVEKPVKTVTKQPKIVKRKLF